MLDKEQLIRSGMTEQIKREITILKQVGGAAQSNPYAEVGGAAQSNPVLMRTNGRALRPCRHLPAQGAVPLLFPACLSLPA